MPMGKLQQAFNFKNDVFDAFMMVLCKIVLQNPQTLSQINFPSFI